MLSRVLSTRQCSCTSSRVDGGYESSSSSSSSSRRHGPLALQSLGRAQASKKQRGEIVSKLFSYSVQSSGEAVLDLAFSDSPYKEEVIAGIDLVQRACMMARSLVDSRSESKAFKDDLSPVTLADYAIQALIEEELRNRGMVTSQVPLIAEEDTCEIDSHFDLEDVERFHELVNSYKRDVVEGKRDRKDPLSTSSKGGGEGGGSRFWVLDPIDGTKGVISDCEEDQYVIGLALVVDNEPVVGIMGMPNWCNWSIQSYCSSRNGAVMAAVKGQGTYLLVIDDEESPSLEVLPVGEVQSVDSSETFEESTFMISQSQSWDLSLPVARGFGGRKPKSVIKGCCGSLTKYAAVALGCASAYVEHPVENQTKLKVWDHVSGVICVEESGGKVTDLSGESLRFDKCQFFKPNGLGVVVSNGKFHQQVVENLATGLS